jgi:hypothetical protein
MWSKRPAKFARHWGISLKEAARFHCTAEHLLARYEGGTSRFDNIAAACLFCNSHRHRRAIAPTPERYRELVRSRVAKYAWHHPWLHKMLGKNHELSAS